LGILLLLLNTSGKCPKLYLPCAWSASCIFCVRVAPHTFAVNAYGGDACSLRPRSFIAGGDNLKKKRVVFVLLTRSRITYPKALIGNKTVWDGVYITLLKRIQAEPAAVKLFDKYIAD